MFNCRNSKLMYKYNVFFETLQQGLPELEFYYGLVYKFRKIVGKIDFSVQVKTIISRY